MFIDDAIKASRFSQAGWMHRNGGMVVAEDCSDGVRIFSIFELDGSINVYLPSLTNCTCLKSEDWKPIAPF